MLITVVVVGCCWMFVLCFSCSCYRTASELRLKKIQDSITITDAPPRVVSAGVRQDLELDLRSGTAESADRALSSVARKLDQALSVEYTVNALIAEAKDVVNLATIYHGEYTEVGDAPFVGLVWSAAHATDMQGRRSNFIFLCRVESRLLVMSVFFFLVRYDGWCTFTFCSVRDNRYTLFSFLFCSTYLPPGLATNERVHEAYPKAEEKHDVLEMNCTLHQYSPGQ